jgi:signal peptidase I
VAPLPDLAAFAPSAYVPSAYVAESSPPAPPVSIAALPLLPTPVSPFPPLPSFDVDTTDVLAPVPAYTPPEPLVLEPPHHVPPTPAPEPPVVVAPYVEDQLFDQASPELTFSDAPTLILAGPLVPQPVSNGAEPSPFASEPASSGPAPFQPTPLFFTSDGLPGAPVSLAKAGPVVDPWVTALQPDPPVSDPPLLSVEASPFFANSVYDTPPPPTWFAGGLDPFEFSSQFGSSSVQSAGPTTNWPYSPPADFSDADALAERDDEMDPTGAGGRHRIGVPEEPPRGRRVKKPARKAPWWELPLLVALAIVIAILVKTFVVQPFYIPSASMEKTLHGCPGCAGDRILVNKPIYHLRDPHPGDIVVFNAPPGWDEEQGTKPPSNPVLKLGRGFLQLVGFVPPDGLVLVKRVIAVGGQTVKGVSTDGGAHEQIMISDHGAAGPWRTLNEPYVYLPAPDPMANFGPVTVPKGRLWVMGDHRNDSADSRYHCGATSGGATAGTTCDAKTSTVPVGDVIGKATVIAWPPSRWRTLGTPSTFAGSIVVPLFIVRRRRRHGRRGGRYRRRRA